jgi:hypothetical protein
MNDDQHYLSVGPWEGDYDDVFEVEHPPSCPLDDIGEDPDGFPIMAMGCPVGHLEQECGLEEFFQHADDPKRDESHDHVTTGRHAIESWEIRYRNYEYPDEYDSGLALSEVTP